MAEPWNGSWNGMPRNPSAIGAIAAVRRAICAGHAMGAREHAPRNAPLARSRLAGCTSFWPRRSAPRRCQSSLGYKPYDVCLCCLGLSLAGMVTSADRPDPISPPSAPSPPSRRVRFTNRLLICSFRPFPTFRGCHPWCAAPCRARQATASRHGLDAGNAAPPGRARAGY